MRQGKFIVFMKLAIFSSIVILLSLTYMITPVVYADAGQVTLKPTDDTYVDNSLGCQNSNYGEQPYLQIQLCEEYPLPAALWNRSEVFLKFNLSSIPDGAVVDVATLQLHTSSVNDTYVVSAFLGHYNSWNESTLTFNDCLDTYSTWVDSVSVPVNNQWYDWNVTGAVKNALNDNNTAVTIILSAESASNSNSVTWFDSKENTTDHYPRLTINWSGTVPEFPTSLILPFFMIATLVAILVYRKKHKVSPMASK